MRQKKSKLFRKIFKDRKQYRAYKKAYVQAELKKRIQVSKVSQEIVDSGKEVHVK